MAESIGIRFDNGPKLHYVELPGEAEGGSPPVPGTRCVVSTRRGLELGLVRTTPRDVKPSGNFVRVAQPDDLATYDTLKTRAEELKWYLKAKVRELNRTAKVVHLEFTLDETLLIVSYTSEAQLPLRPLVGELMDRTRARVEFVNIGPRDQARILGALGACGTGTCSSTWLQSFNAVGIRMARDQQLPLNPEKISGPCGRLMCCLQYEHSMYEQLLKDMPRRGSRACHTESGSCGRVVKLHPLKQSVDVYLDEGGLVEYPVAELERRPTPKRSGPRKAKSRDDGSKRSKPERNADA